MITVQEKKPNALVETASVVLQTLKLFFQPGDVTELRALGVGGEKYPRDESGFYDHEHLLKMANDAARLSTIAKGVYFTFNPLLPASLSKKCNRISKAKKEDCAGDVCVERRRWILVDADPNRISGISSTDLEKAEAWKTIEAIRAFLQSLQWPAPIVADSGNGYHLLYRVDLPAKDGYLVKRILQAISSRFDSPSVTVDKNVFNPSRLTKLYGTFARKGDHTLDRPHRLSAILDSTEQIEIVPQEALERLAAEVKPQPSSNGQSQTHFHAGAYSAKITSARSYINKMPEAISGQRGHAVTFNVACRLVQTLGLDREQALALLKEWNQSHCQPPWSDRDLEHKIDDAIKKLESNETIQRVPPPSSGSSKTEDKAPAGFSFCPIDSKTFKNKVYRREWLINGLLERATMCNRRPPEEYENESAC